MGGWQQYLARTRVCAIANLEQRSHGIEDTAQRAFCEIEGSIRRGLKPDDKDAAATRGDPETLTVRHYPLALVPETRPMAHRDIHVGAKLVGGLSLVRLGLARGRSAVVTHRVDILKDEKRGTVRSQERKHTA